MATINDRKIIEATHTAANFLDLSTKRQVHPITCSRTGLTVAAITVERIAGHVPYMSQWKHTQALHPLFSLEPTALLNFGRSIWNHFCALSPEEAADSALTEKQELLLRVASLAMLHHLSDVDQSIVWLPSLADISNHWSSLLALSYWKNYLESERFRFPALRISKRNNGIDIGSYIKDCWDVKKDYEKKVRESVELERVKAAEMALKVLRDDLAGKAPRSKKLLWRWFIANISSRYAADTEGWMWTLFDAETEQEISQFTIADINIFEEIVLTEVELGSSISHAFLERLSHKRKILTAKLQTYEILVPEAITAEVAAGTISMDEPKLADYKSKVQYMVAMAKWKLAHQQEQSNKFRNEALEKQKHITVKPTYKPDISEYLGTDDDDDDDTPLFDRSKDDPTSDGGGIENY